MTQFPIVPISTKRKGKIYVYHCTECHYSDKDINRIKTHGLIHKISFIRAKKGTRIVPLEQNEIDKLSKFEWQKAINTTAEDVNALKIFKAYGTVVLTDFLNEGECLILRQAIGTAKALASEEFPYKLNKNETFKFQNREISGGMNMVDIPISVFYQNDPTLDFFEAARKVVDKLRDKLAAFINNAIDDDPFEVSGTFSALESQLPVSNQDYHSDSIVSDYINGLLVLSECAPPTEMVPRQTPRIYFEQCPEMNNDKKCIHENDITKLKEKYKLLVGDSLKRVEALSRPVSSTLLKMGTIVLFDADGIHRGVASEYRKTLLFLNLRRLSEKPPQPDIQVHIGLLAQFIYGSLPEDLIEREKGFKLIRMHEDSIPNRKVSLKQLMDKAAAKEFASWLAVKKREDRKAQSINKKGKTTKNTVQF